MSTLLHACPWHWDCHSSPVSRACHTVSSVLALKCCLKLSALYFCKSLQAVLSLHARPLFVAPAATHSHSGSNTRPAMESGLQQVLQGAITSAGAQCHACRLILTQCCRRLTALTDCIDQYVQQQPAFMRLRPLEAVERPHQPSLALSMAKVGPPSPLPPHLMSCGRCNLLDLVPCLALMLTGPVLARSNIAHAVS